MNKLILIGFFSEIYELCIIEKYEIVGVIDEHKDSIPEGISLPYLGNDISFRVHKSDWVKKADLVLTPDAPVIRQKLHGEYDAFDFSSIISSIAIISKSAQFGMGTIVQNQCHISSDCVIGKFVKINVAANVMHGNVIGDYSTIAPNAVLLGRVTVGKRCYIGANSTILPGLTIGDDSIVGAGSVVTKSVPCNSVYYGNPARKLGERK